MHRLIRAWIRPEELDRPAGPPRGPGGGRVNEPEPSPSLFMLATEAGVTDIHQPNQEAPPNHGRQSRRLERDVIRGRGENDKIGLEHETPMTGPLRDALQEARSRSPGIGARWVFPVPKDPSQPASRFLLGAGWKRAEKLAKLKPEPGRGWHSCRRAFATDLKQVPLPDLCALGEWKDPQTS